MIKNIKNREIHVVLVKKPLTAEEIEENTKQFEKYQIHKDYKVETVLQGKNTLFILIKK